MMRPFTLIKMAAFFTLFFAASLGCQTPAFAQFSDTWEFIKAVNEADYKEMRSRLGKGANINAKNAEGRTALFIATEKRDSKLIAFLLEQNANPNVTSGERDEVPLMRATELADVETMKALLEAGANPNAQDRGGETALMKAAKGRRSEPLRLLLENGADFDQADYTGRTALQYANEYRRRSLARLLEEAGAQY